MTEEREIVAVDVGGTHARFALAAIGRGRVRALGEAVKLRTADHAGLAAAWAAFAARAGRSLPREAAIAVAGPVGGELLRFTNNPWLIRPADLPGQLGLERLTLVNDFGAVGHAVAQVPADQLAHLCGPDVPLPATGVVAVIGPGTGLGVASVLREAGRYRVIETEGGHTDFAPLDAIDDAILAHLRARHSRVSAERVVSGSGLAAIHAVIEGGPVAPAPDDAALWSAALGGDDPRAAAALDRFCRSLGSVAGDVALVQGASAVVIAGGLGLRLRDHLPRSGFAARFVAKGRFGARMAAMPVRLIVHPEPGLFGAAAAHAARDAD